MEQTAGTNTSGAKNTCNIPHRQKITALLTGIAFFCQYTALLSPNWLSLPKGILSAVTPQLPEDASGVLSGIERSFSSNKGLDGIFSGLKDQSPSNTGLDGVLSGLKDQLPARLCVRGIPACGMPTNAGLWSSGSSELLDTLLTNDQGRFDAVRAFAIIATMAGFAASVCCVLPLTTETNNFHPDMVNKVGVITILTSASCEFIAIVIFGSMFTIGLSWAFALSIIGMLLNIAAGTLVLIPKCQKNN